MGDFEEVRSLAFYFDSGFEFWVHSVWGCREVGGIIWLGRGKGGGRWCCVLLLVLNAVLRCAEDVAGRGLG